MTQPNSADSLTQLASAKARSVVLWSLLGAGTLILATFVEQEFSWSQQEAAATRLLEARQAADQTLLADERLTMSANLAATTGEQRWIDRYDANLPLIDESIASAISMASPAASARFTSHTRLANEHLVRLEQQAMTLARNGNTTAARAILDGTEYAEQKRILAEGTHEFLLTMMEEVGQSLRDVQKSAHYSGIAMLLLAVICSAGMWRSLSHSLQTSRRALELAEDRLRRMAMHDALTGLPNRRAMLGALDAALARVDKTRGRVALLMLDLNRFKPINDRYGHLMGDRVLKEVAQRLSQVLRVGDFRARLGGDEFVVILEYSSHDNTIERISNRILQALTVPMPFDALTVEVGCSLGAAVFPVDARDGETLLRRADLALYRSKHSPQTPLTMYNHAMDSEQDSRDLLGEELKQALKTGQIVPYFQPLVELSSGRLKSFEVLARWKHPSRGVIPPMEFIPLAESLGLLGDMTLQILQQAANAVLELPGNLIIAINISPQQIVDDGLMQGIVEVLKQTGLPASRLEIELTETALVTDIAAARVVISRIKQLGGCIALDDFGTGYSSLSYLSELAFDKIKIDRSFLRTLHDRPESAKVVNAIISLARSLGAPTVAEGVESIQDVSMLRNMGCDVAQGYFYSPPVPAENLPALLSRLAVWEVESESSVGRERATAPCP